MWFLEIMKKIVNINSEQLICLASKLMGAWSGLCLVKLARQHEPGRQMTLTVEAHSIPVSFKWCISTGIALFVVKKYEKAAKKCKVIYMKFAKWYCHNRYPLQVLI